MDDPAASPRLGQIKARLDRAIAVAEPIANVLWWLYLIGLAITAYLIRDHLGWDDVLAAIVGTFVLIIALALLFWLLIGASHLWKLSLLLAVIGGFFWQGWGSLAGAGVAGAVGCVAIFVETRPLRQARRARSVR